MKRIEPPLSGPEKTGQFIPQDARYARLVDRYSRYIQSPVLRLKFLNRALKATPPRGLAERLPFVGTLPERAMLIVELTKVLPPNQPAPLALRLTSLLYRLRYAVYGVCLMAALAAGAGLVYVAARVAGSFAVPTEAREAAGKARAGDGQAGGGEAVAVIGSEAGLSPDKVWLVEEGQGYELYSNGARVLTDQQTDGESRKYYEFDLEALAHNAEALAIGSRPVGIVYHLSEGDIAPFDGSHNASLLRQSKGLVAYARERKLYNYVIDRFGRIYRVVRDEFTSRHAGHSVWNNGHKLYINLNPSFLGVCFEGKGNSVGPDGINEAQIYAARVLTNVLRARHQIEDANCVPHGLVSVNPLNKLMGFHTDWVAGFPHEALGLSDKRHAEMVAVSRLGFGYDRKYLLAAGGKTWPGLEQADANVREAAARGGVAGEQHRRALYQTFQRLHAMQRALDGREASSVAAAEKAP